MNLKFKLIRDSQSNYGTNIYNLVNTYGTPFTVRDVLMFVSEQNNCLIIEVINPYMSENLPRLVFSKTQLLKLAGGMSPILEATTSMIFVLPKLRVFESMADGRNEQWIM